MSIFPTTILLATDGSEEAELAAQSVLQLANETGSVLHVALVGPSIVGQVEEITRGSGRESPKPREQWSRNPILGWDGRIGRSST